MIVASFGNLISAREYVFENVHFVPRGALSAHLCTLTWLLMKAASDVEPFSFPITRASVHKLPVVLHTQGFFSRYFLHGMISFPSR